jgi:hypothetical protein
MSYNRQSGARTRKQALAMIAARNGQLYEIAGRLTLRNPGMRDQAIKGFGSATINACIGMDWLMRAERDAGVVKIITTVAGDAELRRPYQPTHVRLQRLRDAERRSGL